MQDWRKKKGLMRGAKLSTTFEPIEREILGNLASQVAEAIIARAQSVPKDELAELTGMTPGHKEAPTDPALARLFPDFEREEDQEFEGDNSLLRSVNENDIARAKLENLQVIIQHLGPDGGVEVSLNEPEAHQFVAGLNDIRLFLASSEPPGDSDLIDWLGFNQDSLLQALMG